MCGPLLIPPMAISGGARRASIERSFGYKTPMFEVKFSLRAGAKCCKARRKSLSPRVPQPDVATVGDAHVRTSHFLSAFPTPPPIAVASPGTAMAQCGARPQRSEERYSSSKAWLVDA
jgi:hypothetical protein